ncbi:hypothetical protein P43SY_007320 [Pythium insidiosum]|uniref:DDE-1 domain-containing protein n=1 Tax=Pythium insidiosum TaxID=114742 RepID=A0AAD5LT06_PYTIN|nr:hypothetical protein P43SY_007320 [Pythium insidiosum]
MLLSTSVFAAHIQYAIEETGVLARAGYDDKPYKFIVYGSAPNGRIDHEVRQYNEKVVWRPDVDDSRVLLIDSYGVHKMDAVTSLINDSNTQVEYIPPGLTGVCQPMDVAVMKVFKDQLRRSYLSYCIDNPLPATTAERRALIAQLVYDAWDAVPSQTILNGFVKCGMLAVGPRDATGHFSVQQPTEGAVDEIVDVPDEIPDAASALDADEGNEVVL